jgi:hypothetical protein
MMVVLFYFIIAALAVVVASAISGLLLTNFIIGRFKTSDRAKIETAHRIRRFQCFSRHKTQARLTGV